jgi:hypothetical protein
MLRALGWCSALVTVGLWNHRVLAQTKQACAASYEQAQQQRNAGHYLAAREALLVCAQPGCPSFVSQDCVQWLSEVEGATPTIVVEARDAAGREISEVRVTVDGREFLERLTGRAVAIDPGPHSFVCETAGMEPVHTDIVVREGEKTRVLSVAFAAGQSPSMTMPKERPGVPAVVYALGATAFVATGTFAYFGLTATHDANAMRSTCMPHCQESDVDAARSKFLVANVALGVGVASLGAGVWIYLAGRHASRTAVVFGVRPTAGGGLAHFDGWF